MSVLDDVTFAFASPGLFRGAAYEVSEVRGGRGYGPGKLPLNTALTSASASLSPTAGRVSELRVEI